MSWRLIGIEILRLALAKIPSVGLTSQPSNFSSANWRCGSLRMRCHFSSDTASLSTKWVRESQASSSSMELAISGQRSERSIDASRLSEQMPTTWLPVTRVNELPCPSYSTPLRCTEECALLTHTD